MDDDNENDDDDAGTRDDFGSRCVYLIIKANQSRFIKTEASGLGVGGKFFS